MSTQTTLLISSYYDDGIHTHVWAVKHSCPTEDLEANLRQAAASFLTTVNGASIRADNNDEFNWGDLVVHVPDEILNQFGIHGFSDVLPAIMVDHDENLAY